MTTPTIIRTPKDGSSPYVATSRAAAQDERLSFEARGMLWYLLSKPNDWEIVIGDLGRAGKCGRNRVYRILRELQKYGYLVRERVRDEKGRLATTIYRVYECPRTQNRDMGDDAENTGAPRTQNPYVDNGTLQNTDSTEQKKELATVPKNGTAAQMVREKKATTVPPKARARNQYYDMVATEWFEKRMNTPEFAALGSRIGLHAAWLSGKAITVKRRNEDTGEREVHEIPGCQYEVTPALLKAAKKAWAVEYPKASPPHDILKFVAFVGGWLTKHHAQQEAAAVKPIPNCEQCGGTGLIIAVHPDGREETVPCPDCRAAAESARKEEAIHA